MTLMGLRAEREILIAYLKMKVEIEDWHGIADAAMDIREVDAKISVLRDIHSLLEKDKKK
jgi:hypothetical protein